MSKQKTLKASPNAISSPVSVDGQQPSDYRCGLTPDLFGQPASPAHPSALPMSHMEAQRVKETHGIYSLTSSRSQASAALQSSLESRLRTRLSGVGSTSYFVAWRRIATPAGRPLCRLFVPKQTMKERGFSGWPTPAARDGKDISKSNAFLSQRKRHSPSMATRLLERGAHWKVITAVYCLAMGFPLQWNGARPEVTATQLSRKSQQSL